MPFRLLIKPLKMWDQGTAPADRCKPTRKRDTYTYTHTHTCRAHTCRAHAIVNAGDEARFLLLLMTQLQTGLPNNNSLVTITQELCESLSNPLNILHFELCIILGFLIKTLCFLEENAWLKTKFKHTSIFTFNHQTLSQQRKGLQLV